MILDTQRVETLMTILILSSAASMIMVFFTLWLLSRWAEIKELIVSLLKKIDENYVEQKSEKLKSVYIKKSNELKNNIDSTTTVVKNIESNTTDTMYASETQTTAHIQIPVFEEDLITTKTTKKPATTNDIKEIIKKRKS